MTAGKEEISTAGNTATASVATPTESGDESCSSCITSVRLESLLQLFLAMILLFVVMGGGCGSVVGCCSVVMVVVVVAVGGLVVVVDNFWGWLWW